MKKLTFLEIKTATNIQGKKSSIPVENFKFIKYFYKHNKHFVEIQNLITLEKCIANFQSIKKGSNPFKTGKGGDYFPLEYLIYKTNKIGKSFPKQSQFQYHKLIGDFKGKKSRILIKNNASDDLFEIQYQNLSEKSSPFDRTKYLRESEVFKTVNSIGRNHTPSFSMVAFHKKGDLLINKKKNVLVYVTVENSITKETKTVYLGSIKKNHNPFAQTKKTFLLKHKNKIDTFGKSFKGNEFSLKDIIDKNKSRRFLIENKRTKETKEILPSNFYHGFLKRGTNPFEHSTAYTDKEIAKNVNDLGKKQKQREKFEFIKSIGRVGTSYQLRVKIKNIYSGEILTTAYASLQRGSNPFRKDKKYLEKKFHKEIKSFFKRNKIYYEYEKTLSKSSRIDFVFEHNNSLFGLEVKTDFVNFNSKKKTQAQVNKYKKLLNLKQSKIKDIWSVSESGRVAALDWDSLKNKILIGK